jgi:parallel beta-helix repeat protein
MKKKDLLKNKPVGRKNSILLESGKIVSLLTMLLFLNLNVNATLITVPVDFPTVQQAVNAAVPNDIVYVEAGIYYENVTIDKTITLQGEDRETTIINGGGSGMVVYITANYVTVESITVTNGDQGICLIANYSIHHISLLDVKMDNNIQEAFRALHSGGHHLIENCVFSNNGRASYAHQFSNSIIRNCQVYGNPSGLSVAWGVNTLVANNEIFNNGTGLHFDSMFNSFIENNNVHDNVTGISAGYVASNNIIRENRVYNNEKGIVFGVHSTVSNNKVYHNEISNNIIQGWDRSGNNYWDNGYPSGGNCWQDYTGEDLNNDGIGDSPYLLENNLDNYPLMQSPINLPPVAICQNVQISADNNCEGLAVVDNIDNNSYDPDGDPITLSLSPEGPYPLGETTVTLTVEDDRGGADYCIATISVVDDSQPVITTIATPITLWPPNHKYSMFSLNDFVTSVADNCSILSIDDGVFSKVTSDESEDAPGGGDGNTTNDIIISDDCKSIQLRKERLGAGNGRVYTIYLELTDDYGNLGSAVCHVEVPYDDQGIAIDDGMAYEVLGDCFDKSVKLENEYPEVSLMNFPNPFKSSTTIKFSVAEINKTILKVYNSIGEVVAVLYDGIANNDHTYEIIFNVEDFPNGLYFCLLQSGDLHTASSMVISK